MFKTSILFARIETLYDKLWAKEHVSLFKKDTIYIFSTRVHFLPWIEGQFPENIWRYVQSPNGPGERVFKVLKIIIQVPGRSKTTDSSSVWRHRNHVVWIRSWKARDVFLDTRILEEADELPYHLARQPGTTRCYCLELFSQRLSDKTLKENDISFVTV